MQKGYALIFILVGVLILVGIIGGAYYLGQQNSKTPENNQKACTMDAKICSDGSSVGRVSPDCEFALCQEEVLQQKTADWNSFQDPKYDISFKYPSVYAIEERSFTNEDLYELRIYTKPAPAPSAQYLTVNANILINKSSSKDQDISTMGNYNFASSIYNTFTNYVGDQDILIGKVIDTPLGFVTKIGEQKINNQRVVRYKFQGKGDLRNGEGIVMKNQDKTINIFFYYEPNEWENVDTIIKTVKVLE